MWPFAKKQPEPVEPPKPCPYKISRKRRREFVANEILDLFRRNKTEDYVWVPKWLLLAHHNACDYNGSEIPAQVVVMKARWFAVSDWRTSPHKPKDIYGTQGEGEPGILYMKEKNGPAMDDDEREFIRVHNNTIWC